MQLLTKQKRLRWQFFNYDRATAYLVPAGAFEAMMEKLEDIDLADLVRKRRGGGSVKKTLDDL